MITVSETGFFKFCGTTIMTHPFLLCGGSTRFGQANISNLDTDYSYILITCSLVCFILHNNTYTECLLAKRLKLISSEPVIQSVLRYQYFSLCEYLSTCNKKPSISRMNTINYQEYFLFQYLQNIVEEINDLRLLKKVVKPFFCKAFLLDNYSCGQQLLNVYLTNTIISQESKMEEIFIFKKAV